MITSPDLYQLFFNTTNDAVFVIDAATQRLVDANPQAINLTGYQAEELKTFSLGRLFQQQNDMAAPFFSQGVHDGRKPRCHDIKLVKKNGEISQIAVSTTCIECEQAKVIFVIAHVPSTPQARHDGDAPRDTAACLEEDFPTIIGQSEKIRQVCRRIGSVAKSEVTVLIQGESGTGKEIVANAIHSHSHRHRGPFVKVNCAGLAETLLESELFGHVKGAFTGAIRDRCGRFKQADAGTLLLDEISSMSLSGQAKLLRVLQEHEFEPVGSSATAAVNVRVIAATNTDLQKAVAEGKFREDLYYRLNVFSIHLPPLRERKEDIALLAQHFRQKSNLAIGKKIQAFAPETLAAMMKHDWPGNVRELENAVEHAVLVEKSSVISPSGLPMNLIPQESPEVSKALGLRDMLNLFEREIILETLIRANWIKKRAADMLRIDARNLPYLLRKHNLSDGLRPN